MGGADGHASICSIVKRIESQEEARENAITLLNVLLLQAPTRKKKAQLVSQFENVGIYDALARQLDADYDKVMISDNKSEDEESPFQVQATFFQEATEHVIHGSAYEVEVYKKRLSEVSPGFRFVAFAFILTLTALHDDMLT